MRVPRSIAALPVLGSALLLMLFPVGCSDDESPTGTGGTGGTGGNSSTVPASWGGTWQITSAPAPSPARGTAEVDVVPLCAGLSIADLMGTPDEIPDFVEVTCTGDWGDTEVDVTCSGGTTIEGCTVSFSSTLRLTRVGETFSGTQSSTVTLSGTCGNSEESITDVIEGVRLNTSQFGCDSDLDRELPASWGGIWNITESTGGGRGAELLCPGTDVGDIFDAGSQPEVVGGFTETTAQVFSSWSTPAGACLELHTDTYDLVRTGDSISGTRTSSYYTIVDPSGGGGSECTAEETIVYDVSGSRVSPDISGCGRSAYVPNERWSFLRH